MLEQEGYDLMGDAFEVYNELGYGLSEEIYQAALEEELVIRQIEFVPQAQVKVFYKGRQLRPFYRPDLLVTKEIVVELKAHPALTDKHDGQLFNYLRLTRKHVGYLINFGCSEKLEWKRVIVRDHHERRK